MTNYSQSLQGYGFKIHQRDNFKCRYCGADGTQSFATWLTLTVDHLLPNGHPQRDNPDYQVTACQFCNVADNRYFDQLEKRGLTLNNLSQEELVAQRLRYVQETRQKFRMFWETHVQKSERDNDPEPI